MDKAYHYLNEIIKANDSLIVAVSGGPDSMALFDLVIKLKEEKNINIICAHVNHNTGRIGQKEEEEYVKKYCEEYNIIFELLTIDNYSNNNFEEEAREKRYDFFNSLINKYNAKYLFTAHHSDDLMETILMRLVRGSNLKGYAGFKKVSDKGNYKIIRPLIEVTKDEIIEYLNNNNIKYYIDNTNLEDVHTRNRYRKYILPKLKEENSNVHLKFYKFSRLLNEYNEYFDSLTINLLKDIYVNNILDLNKFNILDKIVKKNIIYSILENIYNNNINYLSDKHVNLILKMASSNKSTYKLDLPMNLIVIKNYNEIEFIKNNINNYKIELNNINKLPNKHIIKIIDQSDLDNNFICRINKNEVTFPLYIRTRLDGDKMYVKNLNGRKKINDIFTDSKIKLQDRDVWPIVVDSNNEIIWLPGLKKSKFDKTKDEKYDIILKYQ